MHKTTRCNASNHFSSLLLYVFLMELMAPKFRVQRISVKAATLLLYFGEKPLQITRNQVMPFHKYQTTWRGVMRYAFGRLINSPVQLCWCHQHQPPPSPPKGLRSAGCSPLSDLLWVQSPSPAISHWWECGFHGNNRLDLLLAFDSMLNY